MQDRGFSCRRLVLASAVVVLGCGWVRAQPQGGPPPAMVVVDAVRLETVEQQREVTGSLLALRRAVLASQEAGLVVELSFQDGDAVKAGQVIAALHDVRARLEVDRRAAEAEARQAAVNERTVDAERAERDLARMEEMRSRGAGNEKEYDNAQTLRATAAARLAQARAELDAARADLRLARQSLEDMSIEAPFDGVIVSKRTEVGQWIERGGPIAEVVALDTIEARLDVPERYIERLDLSGGRVSVRVSGWRDAIEGTVIAVVPDADPRSRLFPVRVALANRAGRLRPGMSVVGYVPTGTNEPTLTVHKDAVLRNEAGEFVYYSAGGVAAVAPIQRMFAVGDRVAIRPGRLQPGDLVVVEGNERMFPGQPLAVQGTRDGTAAPGRGGPDAPTGGGR